MQIADRCVTVLEPQSRENHLCERNAGQRELCLVEHCRCAHAFERESIGLGGDRQRHLSPDLPNGVRRQKRLEHGRGDVGDARGQRSRAGLVWERREPLRHPRRNLIGCAWQQSQWQHALGRESCRLPRGTERLQHDPRAVDGGRERHIRRLRQIAVARRGSAQRKRA